jgi:hypothetical protein
MIVKTSIVFLKTVSDEQLIALTQAIISGLTGNASFPSPTPDLTAITAALADFSDAMAEAANGGVHLTAAKNAKRAVLASLLRQLAGYINVQCDGDIEKLRSTQFPIQKPTRSRLGAVSTPAAPVLKQGAKSGVLAAKSSPVEGASVYNWRIALASAPTQFVQTAQTTAARTTFAELTPGQVYNVQLNAVGASGTSDWSDDATSMVM